MAQENGMTLSALRSDPIFASLSQFFHTFQAAFRPWPNYAESHLSSAFLHPLASKVSTDEDYVFATEDLEKMLIDPSLRYQLEELIFRMLRFLTRNRFISASTWQDYFVKEWDRREPETDNPFRLDSSVAMATTPDSTGPVSSFFDLPMETRLTLLNALCEWQLDDPERLREHLDSEEDPTQWRVDPIGHDAKGNQFWLFDDNRLYKESAKPKKKKPKKKSTPLRPSRRNARRGTRSVTEEKQQEAEEEDDDDDEDEEWTPWKLVCMTVNEWQHFPTRYAKSNHPQNQAFHQILVDDVLPKVIPVIEEHEKNRKKQEALAYRKRSSRILVRDLEALEQQQQQEGMDAPFLSRSEKRRLERERLDKERQSKAREERLVERERRLEAKAQAEAIAAEKTRMAREQRLARRHGSGLEGDNEAFSEGPWQQQGEEEKRSHEFKIVLKLGNAGEIGKKMHKKAKVTSKNGDPPLGKRKRGRKPKHSKVDEEEENWTFNCSCGVFGKNIDDGTPMIACEKCNEWQHIDCLRRSGQIQPDLKTFEDYAFVCRRCKKREEKANAAPLPKTVDEQWITSQIQRSMVPSSNSYTYTTTPLSIPPPPLLSSSGQPPLNHHHINLGIAPQQPLIQSSERQSAQQAISTATTTTTTTTVPPTLSLYSDGYHHAPTPPIPSTHPNHHPPLQHRTLTPMPVQPSHPHHSPVAVNDPPHANDAPNNNGNHSSRPFHPPGSIETVQQPPFTYNTHTQ